MPNPQVPEHGRTPGDDAPVGPVPPDNQPGHHPDDEQDKPDLNAFAARLGTTPPSEREAASRNGQAPPAPAGRREAQARAVAVGATVLTVVLAVLFGRRLRSRRRR